VTINDDDNNLHGKKSYRSIK